MKKTLAWVPAVDAPPSKGTPVIKEIDGNAFVLAEVWVQGTGIGGSDLAKRLTYTPIKIGSCRTIDRCMNCGRPSNEHKGTNAMCPAKDEKQLPGMKHD